MKKSFIWNPWHGCHKISPGCDNCYLYSFDKQYSFLTDTIKLNTSQINVPIKKNNKTKDYKIPSGSIINTGIMTDFFIEEADLWRNKAWDIIHQRKDCLFYIMTKRVYNIKKSLPSNWIDGWDNVILGCTIETQETADERLPEFVLNIPCKHKHIIVEPILEEVDISQYICGGDIEQVTAGGESCPCGRSRVTYARECSIDWIRSLSEQCKYYDVNFLFHQTGSNFVVNGKKEIIGLNKYERQLSPFYKLDYTNSDGLIKENWESEAKKIELESLAENASKVYNKVVQKNPEYEQLSLDLNALL